jgi:NADH dehydrogenase
MAERIPRVYIVGGGFGGLAAARALAKSNVQVTLVDRRNHHVFQPLLYQVATASLSPADIAVPIRHILRGQANCRVVLAKITGVDLQRKRLLFQRGAVEFDYLILAAGATHSYMGHDEWEAVAPGLKSIEDATVIRRRILLAFESAEYEGDEARRRAALTFAIVGGGPTGVELAGAIKEVATESIPKDFHYIDTKTTRVVLLQGGDRLIPGFPPDLSERAKHDLEKMGVEVRLNAKVTAITADGVHIGEEFLPVRTVFWAAGVKASSLGATLGVKLDKSGRVVVGSDLAIAGHPEAFVIGDMAAAVTGPDAKPVPGVAQGAMQMGSYAGRVIADEVKALAAGRAAPPRKPFSYFDKGSLATIGKARAVAQVGWLHIGGFPAWVLWGLIHVLFLVGFRNRIAVVFTWIFTWIFDSRDARLITGDARLDITTPRPGEHILAVDPAEVAGQPGAAPAHAPEAQPPAASAPPTPIAAAPQPS